jgi:hypothetical protein
VTSDGTGLPRRWGLGFSFPFRDGEWYPGEDQRSGDNEIFRRGRRVSSVTASESNRSREAPKVLVFILGPPAVGKMTVGRGLSGITGLPLFHNHLSIEAVLPVFPFGTEAFHRLVIRFREHMLTEVVQSDLPGLIFTYVWAFDDPGDLEYVKRLKSIFESRDGRVVFAELRAGLEIRLARNESRDRLAAKASKRDVAKSRQRLLDAEARYRMTSDGAFPFPDHLVVDTSESSPRAAARRIARYFQLSTVSPGKDP